MEIVSYVTDLPIPLQLPVKSRFPTVDRLSDDDQLFVVTCHVASVDVPKALKFLEGKTWEHVTMYTNRLLTATEMDSVEEISPYLFSFLANPWENGCRLHKDELHTRATFTTITMSLHQHRWISKQRVPPSCVVGPLDITPYLDYRLGVTPAMLDGREPSYLLKYVAMNLALNDPIHVETEEGIVSLYRIPTDSPEWVETIEELQQRVIEEVLNLYAEGYRWIDNPDYAIAWEFELFDSDYSIYKIDTISIEEFRRWSGSYRVTLPFRYNDAYIASMIITYRLMQLTNRWYPRAKFEDLHLDLIRVVSTSGQSKEHPEVKLASFVVYTKKDYLEMKNGLEADRVDPELRQKWSYYLIGDALDVFKNRAVLPVESFGFVAPSINYTRDYYLAVPKGIELTNDVLNVKVPSKLTLDEMMGWTSRLPGPIVRLPTPEVQLVPRGELVDVFLLPRGIDSLRRYLAATFRSETSTPEEIAKIQKMWERGEFYTNFELMLHDMFDWLSSKIRVFPKLRESYRIRLI